MGLAGFHWLWCMCMCVCMCVYVPSVSEQCMVLIVTSPVERQMWFSSSNPAAIFKEDNVTRVKKVLSKVCLIWKQGVSEYFNFLKTMI